MRTLILTVAALAVVATPAFAKGTACVRHDDIYSWNALNDKQLVVENLRHEKVLLGLIGTCYGFKFRETIAIRARGASGLDCIAKGDDVFVRDNGIGGRCTVISVAPYNGQVGSKPHTDNNADDHGGDHASHGSD